MPHDLEQLLNGTAVWPSDPIDVDRIVTRVRRRRRQRHGVLAATTAAVVMVGAILIRPLLAPVSNVDFSPAADPPAAETPEPLPLERATPTSTPPFRDDLQEPPSRSFPDGPSQSPEDAARDGVVPAVAELPLDLRVNEHSIGVSRIVTDEGVWLTSRLGDEAGTKDRPCVGDSDSPDSLYGRDFVCSDYGEVLLLDPSETRILRAFPLPGLPPYVLAVSEDAVYCARAGDGGLPDSALCRIDRSNYDWLVRVFPWEPASFPYPGFYVPDNWIIDDSVHDGFEDLIAAGERLISIGQERLTPIDPETLEVLDPATLDGSRDFGSVVEIDPDARLLVIDQAEWLSGEEAERAYEEDTGSPSDGGLPNDYYIRDLTRDVVSYPVAGDVEIRMTLYWGYDSGPERFSKPITWEEFARIWADDADIVFPEYEVQQARSSYYNLIVVDGEIVRIDQQYQP